MIIGDFYKAIGEDEFIVEVIDYFANNPHESFTGKVISFPKKPNVWTNKQKVGKMKSFAIEDFELDLQYNRDKKLNELGL
jgi:hypothetical protein